MFDALTVTSVGTHTSGEAELLLDALGGAEAALERLCELTGVEATNLGPVDAWRARVEVDGTPVLISAQGETWSIHAEAGVDLGDAMSVARRLHGLLGAAAEGWDLDR